MGTDSDHRENDGTDSSDESASRENSDRDWGVTVSNGADRGPIETLRVVVRRLRDR